MTILQMHKILEKLITLGHSRKKIVIAKKSFSHPLESDGCTMLDVEACTLKNINILNDDGGLGHGPNNKEKFKAVLVLCGDVTSNCKSKSSKQIVRSCANCSRTNNCDLRGLLDRIDCQKWNCVHVYNSVDTRVRPWTCIKCGLTLE